MDRASQRAWMMQWRRAAVALEEQRGRELRALTDQEALAASDALLSLATALPLDTNRLTARASFVSKRSSPDVAGEPDLRRRTGGPGLLPGGALEVLFHRSAGRVAGRERPRRTARGVSRC